MWLINPIIPGEYRYPTITPFTIPDGHTYLKTLEWLVQRMKQIIDDIDENNVELLDIVIETLNSKIDEINTAFAEFEGEVDDKLASVDTKISELETFVNDAVDSIINNSIEVQDPVVAGLLGDTESETRLAADNLYKNAQVSEWSNVLYTKAKGVSQAVYDFTNIETLVFDESDRVVAIKDALGISENLVAEHPAELVTENGVAVGVVGGCFFYANEASSSLGVMVRTNVSGADQTLISGDSLNRINVKIRDGVITSGAGEDTRNWSVKPLAGMSVVEYLFMQRASVCNVNGHLTGRGLRVTAPTEIDGVRIGGESANEVTVNDAWGGLISAIVIVDPADRQKLNDLRNHMMQGCIEPQPFYSHETRSMVVDNNGLLRLEYGDRDHVYDNTVASITKMLCALVVRKYLTTESSLDTEVEVLEEDIYTVVPEPVLVPGDVVSIRDLIKLMAIPSNNTAPRVVARYIGETYLPEKFGGLRDFICEMNTYLEDVLGCKKGGTHTPGGGLFCSMVDIVSLSDAVGQDSVLRAIHATRNDTVAISGLDPRTVSIEKDIETGTKNNSPFVEFGYGKVGTGGTSAGGQQRHLVSTYTENGEEYTVVVLSVTDGNRYAEMYKSIEAVRNGMHVSSRHVSMASGNVEPSTRLLNITGMAQPGSEPVADNGRINIVRTGDRVDVYMRQMTLPDEGNFLIRSLPKNFRPQYSVTGIALNGSTIVTPIRAYGLSYGHIELGGLNNPAINRNARTEMAISWTTPRPFPSPKDLNIGYPQE